MNEIRKTSSTFKLPRRDDGEYFASPIANIKCACLRYRYVAAGFRSPINVGISSDTVGWIGTAHLKVR